MATLIIDHSQNCLENSPRGGLRKKLNMAFLSCFLLFFYFIGFSSTIACVPTVTWHLTTPELFQKTSGASVTNLEVNNCRNDHVSDTWDALRVLCLPLSPLCFCALNLSEICSSQSYKQPIPALLPLSLHHPGCLVKLFSRPVLCCCSILEVPICELRHLDIFPRPNHTFFILPLMIPKLTSPPALSIPHI